MEKINIAELLKNCPQGMELDCTMSDNMVFEKLEFSSPKYPVVIRNLKTNTTHFLTEYGQYIGVEDAKCVIFPKGKTTWEEFQRPFKDGDIVATGGGGYVFILKKVISYNSTDVKGTCYFGVELQAKKLLTRETNWYFSRLATEEEKAELFKAIKENGYKWNEETKTLEKVSQYPQTFEECCTVLGLTESGIIGGYRRGLLTQFRNLLICRDAYWKIADDWKFNFEEKCYYLCNEYHEIQDFNGVCDCNAVLAFPTAEMRDAFYDNFEELIKECKSLL